VAAILAGEPVSCQNISAGKGDFPAINLANKFYQSDHTWNFESATYGPDYSVTFLDYFHFPAEQHHHSALPGHHSKELIAGIENYYRLHWLLHSLFSFGKLFSYTQAKLLLPTRGTAVKNKIMVLI
jgi:hypothetical protein